ncbi:MAG: pilus assembly protein TadG-related protein [Rhodopila sp.]
MKRNPSPASWARRLCADQRGVSTMLAGIGFIALLGITGLVVDLGHIKSVQRALQTSADAAALAGAQQITAAPANAVSTAIAYSAVGGKNAVGNLTATMVSGYPALKCFTSTGVACTVATANANPAYQPISPLCVDSPAGEAGGACGSAA